MRPPLAISDYASGASGAIGAATEQNRLDSRFRCWDPAYEMKTEPQDPLARWYMYPQSARNHDLHPSFNGLHCFCFEPHSGHSLGRKSHCCSGGSARLRGECRSSILHALLIPPELYARHRGRGL